MNDVVRPAFACPFLVVQMPNCEALNRELRALFLDREARGSEFTEEYPVPTLKVNTFESVFTVFNWTEPCVQHLKQFCFAQLGQALRQVNGTVDLSPLKIFNHAWFHITRAGGYMGSHNHPMASWSGVYCVDAGGQDPDNPDSGTLRFHDPRNSINMYMDAGNNTWVEPWAPGVLTFPAKAGQLVIFPSFLMHDVAPFTGPGERIVVAFNAWIKNVEAEKHAVGAAHP
ncbi:MAG: putative 2OG-Fe(II) oxygenase [Pseudomonadota bacterium]